MLSLGAFTEEHKNIIGGALLVAGVVGCLSGIGTLVCVATSVAVPAIISGSQAYFNSGGDVGQGLLAGAIAGGLGIGGLLAAPKLALAYINVAAPRIAQQMKQVSANVSQAAINRTVGPVRRTTSATVGAAYSQLTEPLVPSGKKTVTPGPSMSVINRMDRIIGGSYGMF